MGRQYDVSRVEEFMAQDWFAGSPEKTMQSIYDILGRIMNKIPVESRRRFRLRDLNWTFDDEGKVMYEPPEIDSDFSSPQPPYFNIWIERAPYIGENRTLFISIQEIIDGCEHVGFWFTLLSHLKEEPFYPLVQEEYKQLLEAIPALKEVKKTPSGR